MTLAEVLAPSLLGLVAVGLGGPVTLLVFRLADRRSPRPSATHPTAARDHPAFATSIQAAGSSLRGGAWIGALERLAVYASVLSGWREALVLTVAIKGLGRYPELRGGDNPGTAERFIIGTFVSVLWACGCAAVSLAITG